MVLAGRSQIGSIRDKSVWGDGFKAKNVDFYVG